MALFGDQKKDTCAAAASDVGDPGERVIGILVLTVSLSFPGKEGHPRRKSGGYLIRLGVMLKRKTKKQGQLVSKCCAGNRRLMRVRGMIEKTPEFCKQLNSFLSRRVGINKPDVNHLD
jgi:hypothetical protein